MAMNMQRHTCSSGPYFDLPVLDQPVFLALVSAVPNDQQGVGGFAGGTVGLVKHSTSIELQDNNCNQNCRSCLYPTPTLAFESSLFPS